MPLKTNDKRKAIILLVVLALLTLFAIVGVSFVLYAGSQATSARNAREAESPVTPNMDSELLFSWFLSQLIYDADDVNGVYSAMRGHSLARTMYGLNAQIDTTTNPPTYRPWATVNGQPVYNNVSYNGIGRLHFPGPGTFGDEFQLLNYTWFQTAGDPLRDPERYYTYGDPTKSRIASTDPYPPNSFMPFNAPYSYPDLNSAFLAAVKAGPIFDQAGTTMLAPPGAVLAQSFYRRSTFGALTRTGANWRSPQGKYLILRPRPRDQKKNPNDPNEPELFPYPEDEGGDVKNLIGSPGTFYAERDPSGATVFKLANNDSIWMDLGAPVMTAPDGTKFKALFAPLIMGLDNRLNLNVHGNIRGNAAKSNVSNKGWGPWEVSLQKVLDQPPTGTQGPETINLFRQINTNPDNQQSNAAVYAGRYGGKDLTGNNIPYQNGYPLTQPYGSQVATPGTAPHYYAPVDFDGANEKSFNMAPSGAFDPQSPIPLPSPPNSLLYWFPVAASGNVPAGYTFLDNTAERTHHPLLFNYFNPQKNGTHFDAVFPISNMEALLRYGETNAAGMTSEMYRLLGTNFDPAVAAKNPNPNGLSAAQIAAIRRGMVTTHSMGMDRAGVTPWAWNPNGASPIPPFSPPAEPNVQYALPTSPTTPTDLYPKGLRIGGPPNFGPIPFPDLKKRLDAAVAPQGSEFSASDWRAVSAAVQRVDLNRYLTPYPTLPPNGPYQYRTDPAVQAQVDKAQLDRQVFAKDIYLALVAATGAFNPTVPQGLPSPDQIRANRWLAQLAVNIVDFIDPDDFMTPFDWVNGPDDGSNPFPTFASYIKGVAKNEVPIHYVFGTELPRVTLNEVYAEYLQEGGDPLNMKVNVWAELHNNSFYINNAQQKLYDPNDPNRGQTYLKWPGLASNYRIILCYPDAYIPNLTTPSPGNPYLRRPDNVLGSPFKLRKLADTFPVVYTGPEADMGHIHRTARPAQPGFCIVDSFPDSSSIQPISGAYAGVPPNQGFYLVGPDNLPGGTQVSLIDQDMAYKYQAAAINDLAPKQSNNQLVTVVLQRLACPYMPYNPVPNTHYPANPPPPAEWANNNGLPVNPYITIDYVDTFWLGPSNQQQELQFRPINNGTAGQPTDRAAFGRTQPFAGSYFHLRQQAATPNGEVKSTFFRHNGVNSNRPVNPDATLKMPFDWLHHLDRQVNSPMELLHVSAFKPHELLQQFITFSGTPTPTTEEKYTHHAPWFDQTARLYRAFEFLHTSSRAAGVAAGGRIPGKININTVWDEEILQALADPQTSNYFTAPHVKQTFDRLLLLRKGGGTPASLYIPELADRPFLSMATGYSMNDRGTTTLGDPIDSQHTIRGIGINDTFLRAGYDNPSNPKPIADKLDPDGGWGATNDKKFPRLFQTPTPGGPGTNINYERPISAISQHPYFQNQLLDKIFNNLTTKSNVFGVWVTVGFFKVNDASYAAGDRPVKLEAELGKAEGRNVRHRMFAIVDRTNLTFDPASPSKPGGPPIFLSTSYLFDRNQLPVIENNAPLFHIAGSTYYPGNGTPNDPAAIIGEYEGIPWKISRNMKLTCEYGTVPGTSVPSAVDVTVTQVKADATTGAPVFQVNPDTFRPHSSPFVVIPWRKNQATDIPPPQLGNPGPQSRFNPRDYPWVVRYFQIIE